MVGGADAAAAEDEAAGREVRPGMIWHQLVDRDLRVVDVARGSASITSPRLCGGMLVAMPTAMPPAPLTSRLGNRAGSTVGSCSEPS